MTKQDAIKAILTKDRETISKILADYFKRNIKPDIDQEKILMDLFEKGGD